MNSKKIIYGLSVLFLLLTIIMVSCKKKETPAPEPTESGQSSSDSRDTQGENDAAVNDINSVIGDNGKLHGKSTVPNAYAEMTGTICGLSVDTAGINSGTIRLNYDGTTCNNRTRTGSIKFTIQDYTQGKRWKNVGCVIKVDFLSYKITRASDGKSIMLNGTQYLTNTSGGTWWELLIVKTQTTLVSTLTSSNLAVTFEDNKTATYNINRKITYTIPGNIITCRAEGIGTSGGLTNLENFGTTRDGDAFTSQVTNPIVWNVTCGPGAPVQGEVNIVASKSFDLRATFGVDRNGNVVTPAPNQCAFGWKLDWTFNGNARNKIFGYN